MIMEQQWNFYKEIGKLQDALDDYSKAIDINQRHYYLFSKRGDLCKEMGQLQDALVDYTKAISLNQKDYSLFSKRGNVYKVMGNLQGTLDDYTKAIGLNQGNYSLFLKRGNLYKKLGKLQNAFDDYQNAIDLKPDLESSKFQKHQVCQEIQQFNYSKFIFKDDELMIKQAYELFEQNELDKALLIFNDIKHKDSSNAEIYLKRSQTHLKLHNLQQSLEDVNCAILLNPSHARAYHYRGDTYHIMKKEQEALSDYSKVLELDPKYESAYLQRGNIYDELNQQFKAVLDYSKYLDLNSHNLKVLLKRANLYLEMKQFCEALEDYLKIIQLDIQNSSAYIGSGLSYFNTKQFEQAIKQFTLAIQYDFNCVLAYYNRGLAYSKINNFEEALKNFEKALKIQPDNPLFLAELCGLHIQNKLPTRALFIFKKLEEAFPEIERQLLKEKYQLCEAEFKYVQDFIQHHRIFYSEKLELMTINQNNILIKLFSEFQNQNNEDERNFQKICKFLKFVNPKLKLDISELANKFAKSKERSEMIQKEENIIFKELRMLNQPQNHKKKLYYISFYTRILTFFNMCIEIQENLQLFTPLQQPLSIQQLNQKINKFASKILPTTDNISFIDSVLLQMHLQFDYGKNLQQYQKFLEKIQKIAIVIKSKSEEYYEREREIQNAAFYQITTLLDLNNIDGLLRGSYFFMDVQEIVELEVSTRQEALEPLWQLGIENSMGVINSMLMNQGQILTSENLKLRRIIIDSFQKQQNLRQKKNSSTCCLI